MDLRRLREFILLAEYLNFSEAAKQLFITQPVLSRHIVDLECELGVQLFIRDKHTVQLTTIGKLFLQESKAVISRYEEACQKIRLVNSGFMGNLKIGFLDRSVKKFFTQSILHFNQVYPKIQLDFFSHDLDELLNALKRDEIDLGFTLSLGLGNTIGLNQRTIYREFLYAVVPHNHPLADKSSVTLSSLVQESFIMLTRDQHSKALEHTLQLCESKGFHPNVVKEASDIETALLMVELGIGIFIAPRHHIVNANPNVYFINLEDDDCRIDIDIVWKKNNSNPSILPFIKEVENAYDNFVP